MSLRRDHPASSNVAVSVRTAAQLLDCSESFIRAEIRNGRLKAKRFGARVSISVKDLEDYHNNQPDWTPGKAPVAANKARRGEK